MTARERKERPVYSGVLRYFPDALMEVARCSWVGNEQHNPGQPLHWDRAKSTDEADALVRHLLDAGTVDTDGIRHTAKVAWRALALLQKELEAAAVPVSETHVPERDTPPAFDIPESRTNANTPDTEYHPSRLCSCASCQTLSYDEQRGEMPPCQCGRLFTHPHKCIAEGRCLALDHPHARK